MQRKLLAASALACAAASLLACGSGSGGSAPTLSNLSYSPQTAPTSDTPLTLSGSLDIADPDGDVARLEVGGSHSVRGTLRAASQPIQHPAGATRGTLPFTLQLDVSAASIGTYTLTFRVFDAKEHGSNALSAVVVVTAAQPRPLPAATQLQPSTAAAGSGAFVLDVFGDSFDALSVVQWNGAPRTTTFLGATHLQAQIGAGDIALPGLYPVTVSSPPPGGGTSAALTFTVGPGAAEVFQITSLSPSTATAGSGAIPLQVRGGGFDAGAQVLWNGSPRFTSFLGSSILQAQLTAADLAQPTTAQVSVRNASGAVTAAVPFSVAPLPLPVVSSVSPSSAFVATGAFALQVLGSGFQQGSTVTWNGIGRATVFLGGSQLSAQILASDIAQVGTAQIAVVNPSGDASNSVAFQITNQRDVTLVGAVANDIAWDPYRRKIYATIPGVATQNPNSIAVVDPFTGTVEGAVFAGSEPTVLAISDDGRFLYAGLNGASSVQRFVLPDLAPDIAIPLGNDPFFGPYRALDLQVAPGASHTIAVTLGVGGVTPSAEGGVVIFDDASPRATRAPGFGGTGLLFDSLQWGTDASTLFAADNESSGFDFYTLAVDPTGVTLTRDVPNAFSAFRANIHFDPATGLVYSESGRAISTSGALVGTFNASGPMTTDAAIGRAWFYDGASTVHAFDLAHFTPAGTFGFVGMSGAGRVLRFGADGLAIGGGGTSPFGGSSAIALVRNSVVLPSSIAPNPAPTVASLTPATVAAGTGNLRVTVAGAGFVPGSVVTWNGAERTTRFVSATQLVAFVPASDVAAAGSAQVAVASPTPGGGTSAAAPFAISP